MSAAVMTATPPAPGTSAELVDLARRIRYAAMTDVVLRRCIPDYARLSYTEAVQRRCVLMQVPDGGHVLVVTDPFDDDLRAWAQARVAGPYRWGLALADELQAFLAESAASVRALDAVATQDTAEPGAVRVVEDVSLARIGEDASPVVRLVNSTLHDALKAGASDIHLEASVAGLLIKYRVDGVLVAAGSVQGVDVAEQTISRIKVLSELDIAERRVPQDGRFRIAADGREIDLRVSIMPSISGEDAVVRILDKRQLTGEQGAMNLCTLGFDHDTLDVLRRLSRVPYGMLLVTGPTGSGKTTTLYAALSEINDGRDKIITIEDPVEYELPGVLQIPVHERKGLTFARGLRSILRHDPDKILVGEIRDAETAQIAVQAALTGHLVFTSLHANNAFDVIGRFLHMGLDPYNLVAALNGIVAQRLLRLNCTACAEPVPVADVPSSGGLARQDALDTTQVMSGRGCTVCRGTGYRGRTAIAECLLVDDEIRELIVARTPIRRLKETVRARGTRFLREAALDLVRQGRTDLREVNRVVV